MLLAAAHRGVEIRHDDQAAKQPVEQRLYRVVASHLAKRCHAAKLAQLGRVERRRRAAGNQVERNDVRAPFFAFAQRRQNRLGIGRLPGDDQLQMPAKRGLDGGDVFSRHADLIGQQTKHSLGLFDGCLRPGADALVGGLQLLEHIQPRPFFGLKPQQTVQFGGQLGQALLQIGQALLAFLDGAAMALGGGFPILNIAGKLAKPLPEFRLFFLKLGFLRRKFLEPNGVAALLQIDRVDLVADTGQFLRDAVRLGLRLAKRLLPLAKLLLEGIARSLFFIDGSAHVADGVVRVAKLGLHPGQLLLGIAAPLLGLRDVFVRLGHVFVQLLNALVAELNPALEPLEFGLQVGAFFLRLVHLFFNRTALLPRLVDQRLFALNCPGEIIRPPLELTDGLLALPDGFLNLPELMPRELAFKILEFLHELLVAPRLAGLTLERADLPLDLADGVGHAQQILIGVVEFSQRLFFLRLEARDASRLLEHQPPVVRFAGDKLGDVALGHDAVAGPPHAGAHEQLLDVLEPARNFVDEIITATIAEQPARHGDFVVRQIDSGRLELILVDAADGHRHLRHAERLALVGAVENHIHHSGAPERLGRLLAQNPPNRIGNIRLAAAVRADNRRDARLKVERRLVRKRLKAQGREILQIHVAANQSQFSSSSKG